jgi:hypothetical protein
MKDANELKMWENEIAKEHMKKRVRRRDAARAGDDFTGLGKMFNMDGHENRRAALARGRKKWESITKAQRSHLRKMRKAERAAGVKRKRN